METAKELFDKMLIENDETTSTEMMIEFAKKHVTEALHKASEKFDHSSNKIAVLGSYSLENIN